MNSNANAVCASRARETNLNLDQDQNLDYDLEEIHDNQLDKRLEDKVRPQSGVIIRTLGHKPHFPARGVPFSTHDTNESKSPFNTALNSLYSTNNSKNTP